MTRIGKGSISLAHTGLIPESFAARGKPPEPSNKLPNVNMIRIPYKEILNDELNVLCQRS